MTLYVKITDDKYELPLAVAESVPELAKMCGIKTQSIHEQMSHNKKLNKPCQYIKIEVEED